MRATITCLVLLCGACEDEPAPAPFAADFSIPGGGDMAVTPSTTVTVNNDFFEPMTVTVAAGTTVNWNWTTTLPHSVTSDTGFFDSGILLGGSFSLTFPTAGNYPYHCVVHGSPGVGMFGMVIVQ